MAALLMSVVLAGAAVGLAGAASTLVEVKDVRIDRSADGLTVTVRATGSVPYEARTLGSPARLVIDLEGAHYAAPNARWASRVDPIREVRGSQWKPGVARIVVELIRKVGYRIDRTAEGLVVVLEPSPPPQDSAPAPERTDVAGEAPTIPPEFGPVVEVKDPPAPAQPVVAEVKAPPVPAQPAVAEAKTPPVPASTVQATTQDGRLVALQSDGAWK
ncbi:MAG: AMIN domain-containing protein, partial [Candidatus Rokuibacteriota bacterium]